MRRNGRACRHHTATLQVKVPAFTIYTPWVGTERRDVPGGRVSDETRRPRIVNTWIFTFLEQLIIIWPGIVRISISSSLATDFTSLISCFTGSHEEELGGAHKAEIAKADAKQIVMNRFRIMSIRD